MPANFNFVYSVIWTSVVICVTYGLPIKEKDGNILDTFVSSFAKNCSVLRYVILPKYKGAAVMVDEQNYNLSVPLEACATKDMSNPAIPICNEAFRLIYNLSTCRPDFAALNETVPSSIKPITIAAQTDNVCEAFFANQKVFVHSEEFIAFRLADKQICPLICNKDKAIMKACSFLLWGYQTQVSIYDIRDKLAAEKTFIPTKTLSESGNAKTIVGKDSKEGAKNEAYRKANVAPFSKIDTQEEKSSDGTPVNAVPDSDEHKQEAKNPANPSESIDPKSANDKLLSDEGQNFPSKQKESVSKVSKNTKSDTKVSASTVSVPEKSTIVVSSNFPNSISSSPKGLPVHGDSGETDVKDQKGTSLNDELQKGSTAVTLGQAKPHSDKSRKESGATVQSDASNAAEEEKFKKTEVPPKSSSSVAEGGDAGTHLTEENGVDHSIGNEETIPEIENPVDSSVKDKENEIQSEDQPPVPMSNPQIDMPAKDTLGEISHQGKNTENAKDLTVVSETPSSEVPLQSMDELAGEKSAPVDDDDENFVDGRFDGESSDSNTDYGDDKPPDNGLSQPAGASVGNDAQGSESKINSAADRASKVIVPAAFPEQEDTHFFFYFISIVIFAIGAYILFHNKQKIFALIIEGRHERRRRSGASYRKLETK